MEGEGDRGKSSKEHPASAFKQVKDAHRLNVTLVTNDDGWKITVTDQLLTELAKNPLVKVSGLVARITPELRDWAEKSNIELVVAEKWKGFSDKERLAFPPDSLDIDILIIHSYGKDLGRQAQPIRAIKKCKWVHIVHTISEELAKYMETEASLHSQHQSSEHDVQLELCEEADIVIAVGPKVAEAYRSYLYGKDVIDLTPQIVHDLIVVRPVRDYGDVFRLVISATYFEKYFKVKGLDIAAQAITSLRDTSYRIIFIVQPKEDRNKLERWLKQYINVSQFIVRPFKRDTENWKKLFFEVDLAIMPSRTEGFGTSSLSAISADSPVLVSGNSGLGMALKKLPSGGKHVIDSEDPQDWANRIREVREKGARNCAFETQQLRKEYMDKFNWRGQCDQLVKKMMAMFPDKQGTCNPGWHSESKKKSVEHLDEGDSVESSHFEAGVVQRKLCAVQDQKEEVGAMAKSVQSLSVTESVVRDLEQQMTVPGTESKADVGFSGISIEETGIPGTDLSDGVDLVDAVVTDRGSISRSSIKVTDIPYSIYGKICQKLNIKDEMTFKDFRMLGEKMGFHRDITRNVEQRPNPTMELLQLWSRINRQATVGCLIELLKDKDLERMDVVDILEDWVQKKA